MNSAELRSKFLNFFEKRGHVAIPSASLIPENDPSVLFTTAGMQPLVPYLLGQKHPKGNRLVNIQKCVRTGDIDDIGDNTHATFFEMMGNWSLGDYFKEEAINWSYELLTNKEEGFGLDPNRLYVTVFEGDENAPRDNESFQIWRKIGIPENRIYFMPAKNNWWSPGENGPCGPDTEMFYDVIGGLNLTSKEEFIAADEKQQVVEIWNDVFMEYEKKDGKVIGKLQQKNVDTGSGFERVLMVLQNKNNIFETDVFAPVISKISELCSGAATPTQRIIADHVRTSMFLINDGVTPSNTDRGYVLRKLIRRAILKINRVMGKKTDIINQVALEFTKIYPELEKNKEKILDELKKEQNKFEDVLEEGLKKFESGEDPFVLFTSYGFPIEMTVELAKEKGQKIDIDAFNERFRAHQELSRASTTGKFKGGLADTSEMSVKYHTATHLLNAALKEVLGSHIEQKGSNITPERLRFDFSHPEKMTDEQKKEVEDLVNKRIQEALPVSKEEMALEKARETGATGVFGEKYADVVTVYSVGDNNTGVFSKEICGGPHVANTSELGKFKIQKEESVSQGVRRIKAVLE